MRRALPYTLLAGLAIGLGCAGERDRGVLLIIAAGAGERPDHIRLDWVEGQTRLLQDVRIPERGSLPDTGSELARVFIAVDGTSGLRTAVARGIKGAAVVATGETVVALAATRVNARITLQPLDGHTAGDGGSSVSAADALLTDRPASAGPSSDAPGSLDTSTRVPDAGADGGPPAPIDATVTRLDTSPPSPDTAPPPRDAPPPPRDASPPPPPNLVTNPEFDRGVTSWAIGATPPAAATLNAVPSNLSGPNALRVDISDGSTEVWHLGVYQAGIPLVAGRPYVLTFLARADAPKPIDVLVQSGPPGYVAHAFTSMTLDPVMTAYRFAFTINVTDANMILRFNVGGNRIGLLIDNVVLTSP